MIAGMMESFCNDFRNKVYEIGYTPNMAGSRLVTGGYPSESLEITDKSWDFTDSTTKTSDFKPFEIGIYATSSSFEVAKYSTASRHGTLGVSGFCQETSDVAVVNMP